MTYTVVFGSPIFDFVLALDPLLLEGLDGNVGGDRRIIGYRQQKGIFQCRGGGVGGWVEAAVGDGRGDAAGVSGQDGP